VVSKLQINITKVFGPHELIKEVIDLRNLVLVSDCDFIQSPVINEDSLGSIFILFHHDWALAR
jgi:hypothetical protein